MELKSNGPVEHFTLQSLAPPTGTYSHGVVAQGFLFTCGVGPTDPVTGEFSETGIPQEDLEQNFEEEV